jgi:MYXO-CTERM domain-containing protein
MLAPATVPAQNFNPNNADRLLTGVTIEASGLGRLNEQNQQVGTLGVQDCRDLRDRDDPQVGFTVEITDQTRRKNITRVEYNDAYLMEFARSNGFPGTCRHDDDNDCRRLDADDADITLTPVPNGQFVEGRRLEVQIGFEKLLEYRDDRREACAFASPDEAMSGPRIPLQGDGGFTDVDGGMDSDISDTTPTDTDSTRDTGSDGGTDAGMGTTAEGDRIYAARIFLTGFKPRTDDEQLLADAVLRFDFTRPPSPASIRGDATENKVVVKFDPPSQTSDIASYHVFHSTSQMSSSKRPEELQEDDDVERQILASTNRQDDGSIRGSATGIDRNAGEQLYIAVASRDAAGNYSRLGQRDGSVTIKESINFPYDGSETGGCGCSSASALPTGLLLALLGIGALGLGRARRE